MDLIRLHHAALCLEDDCQCVFDMRRFPRCPACASGALMALGKWLGRLDRASGSDSLRASRTIERTEA